MFFPLIISKKKKFFPFRPMKRSAEISAFYTSHTISSACKRTQRIELFLQELGHYSLLSTKKSQFYEKSSKNLCIFVKKSKEQSTVMKKQYKGCRPIVV